jgi:1-acyl-sn-glycerol-3-phosphate acyltransferase/acyl carrier protein
MCPSHYVFLDRLPLTPNGKIDKKALPQVKGYNQARKNLQGPRNDIEKEIKNLWSVALKRQDISIDDNFFEIGGYSLLALQLLTQIKEKLGVEISLHSFFESPTIADLSLLLSKQKDTPKEMSDIPVTKNNVYVGIKRKIVKAIGWTYFFVMIVLFHAPFAMSALAFKLVNSISSGMAKILRLKIPRLFAKLILKLENIEYEVIGVDKIPSLMGKPVVIFCNHNSTYDTMIQLASLPFIFKSFRSDKDTVARSNHKLAEWAINAFDLTFMHYKEDAQATAKEFEVALEHLKQGNIVSFYPEGNYSEEGKVLGKFGDTCTKIAIDSGSTLVPIVIWNTKYLRSYSESRKRRSKIKVIVGDPIETSAYADTPPYILTDHVRNKMYDTIVEHQSNGADNS